MAHFAKIVDGIVTQVISADDDFVGLPTEKWVKTSYNTKAGIHYGEDNKPDDGEALRANYAGIGYIYDEKNDVFYPPKTYTSWVISGPRWLWVPPVDYPSDGKKYVWDESTISWVED